MLNESPKLLESRPVNHAAAFATQAHEMRHIAREAVDARRDRGQSEAVFQAARELRISTRRVLGILRGEVGRIWADEMDHARDWYVRHCEQQAAIRATQADDYRVRAADLRERLR